jgi:hypothetical protein
MKGFRAAAALDLFIVLVGTVASMVQVSVSQAECGSQAAGAVCANALCCSQFGYCGTGSSYCGTGCQSQCGGSPTPPPPPSGSGGVGNILTNSLFDIFFPNRNSFYTYAAFISAANSYPSFGTTGNSTQTAQEVAAFCAHVTQENGYVVLQQSTTAGLQVFVISSCRFVIVYIHDLRRRLWTFQNYSNR